MEGGGMFMAARYVLLLVLAAVVLPEGEGMGMRIELERAFPSSHGVPLNQLRERDRLRHGRFLQQNGVIDFPVQGSFDPFTVGLYYTTVSLGSPPKDFFVQIDTGSDVLWVGCKSCEGCPTSSGLQISLDFFDPQASQTAQVISCSDQKCALGAQTQDSGCTDNHQCGYAFQYGDGSGTSGFYVSDYMHFNTVIGTAVTSNSSAPVVFGCSTSQSGDLTKSDRAVDGIFGFGQQSLSVISQLASQGVTPNAFSHCLKGSSDGGGILVFGQVVEPSIVYTPLVPSQPHYNLNLESISVNGQALPIDSSVFQTSQTRGTIVDSGTTLAYLAEEAYEPFVNAINQVVTASVQSFVTKGNQCYLVSSSVSEIFPQVSMNFAGGASMVLNPQDYLLQQNSISGDAVWCIGFQKIQGQGLTILGDLVLKDKVIVYDLGGQRIGWANYNCSSDVNVSTTSSNGKSEFVNAGQIDGNGSPSAAPHKLLLLCLLWMYTFGRLSYL